MNIQETLSEMATDLYNVGAIDNMTLLRFNKDLLDYSPRKIVSLREKLGLSQAVFAQYLNVSDKVVKRWEQGKAKPSGASLKLLSIVEKKGLDIFA
jgi:putative transcriptional regulator